MKIALFAEGPDDFFDANHPFVKLWRDAIFKNLGLPAFSHIYPINKKFLISMRTDAPKISGASIKLDAFIERKRKQDDFECAVVAWDLVPGWAGGVSKLCRWDETVDFYRGIARSSDLPALWVQYANNRVLDLEGRALPSQRAALTKVSPGAILGVCMDSMFESLITADEKAVKSMLGCAGIRVPNWPNWKNKPLRVDNELLAPAITAARKRRPQLREPFVVRGDLITAKHEWGHFFLNTLLAPASKSVNSSHQIATRLKDVL